MENKCAKDIVESSTKLGGSPSDILDYLIELETEKFRLLQLKGGLSYVDLEERLKSLEYDVNTLKNESIPVHQPGEISETTSIENNNFEKITSASVFVPSRKSLDLSHKRSSKDQSNFITSTSVDIPPPTSIRHSTSNRMSMGGHSHHNSQPLYTLPNAFNYDIKLRGDNKDAFGNSIPSPEHNTITSPSQMSMSMVLGSRERKSDIRHITDRLSVAIPKDALAEMLNGTHNSSSQINNSERHSGTDVSTMMASTADSNYKALFQAVYQENSPSFLGAATPATPSAEGFPVHNKNITPLKASLDTDSASGDSASSSSSGSSASDNILEFCIVEADWSTLATDDNKFISPLLPSREQFRYPVPLGNQEDTNTQLIQSQNFFFPSGVQVDFVAPSVVPLYTKKCNYKRHIVPFMDTQGVPTYACCLTVTQAYSLDDIVQIDDKIVTNLVRINRMKHAVICIQKAFRQYVAYTKAKNWSNLVNISSVQGVIISGNSSTGSISKGGRKSVAGPITPVQKGQPPSVQQPAQPGFFSKLFRRSSNTADELDHSAHTATTAASLTGSAELVTPVKDAPVAVKPVTPATRTTSSIFFGTRSTAPAATATVGDNKALQPPVTSPSASRQDSADQQQAPSKSAELEPEDRAIWTSSLNEFDSPAKESTKDLAGKATDDTSSTAEAAVKTPKEMVLQLLTMHPLAPSDLNELCSLIIDTTNKPKGETTGAATTGAASTDASATHKTTSSVAADIVSATTPAAVVKGRILHLIDSNTLSAADIDEILSTVSQLVAPVTPQRESAGEKLLRELDGPGSPLSYNAAEMAAALEESLNVSLENRYRTNRVVVAQKAYCIVTSVAEYTFIFKVLDAIAEAESKSDSSCSVPSEPTSPTGHRVVAFESSIHSDEKETRDLGRELASELKNLTLENNNIEDLDMPRVMSKRELNRLTFLDSVQSYMLDYYCNAAQYQVQDLALNFTIPSRPSASGKTKGNNPEAANKILSKYAGIAEAEKQNAHNKSGTASNNWTTPAQQISSPNSRLSRSFSKGRNALSGSTPTTPLVPATSDSSNTDTGGEVRQIADETSAHSLADENAKHNSHLANAGVSCGDERFRIVVPEYIDSFLIDRKSLLTTKEWSCAVLFAHLNAQVVFKVINLLLMEKSLIIYGKNPGIVTTITLAVINLISPFIWEGIFVPLVPDNARELFGAPVPLILGTISPPRIADVSTSTAILYLNDDIVLHSVLPPNKSRTSLGGSEPAETCRNEFLAWFVRLPEVSADMPLDEEISKRIEYTRHQLCAHYISKLEFVDKKSSKSGIFSRNKGVPTDPMTSSHVRNNMDSLLMCDVPSVILKQVRILITAIKRSNFNFCGNVIKDASNWKKFLKHSHTSGEEEFYPEYFMEPLRNYLEFQEAMVHTQLFVAFMDKVKKEQEMLEHVRMFISHWIYFRIVMSKKNKKRHSARRKLPSALSKSK